MEDSLITDYGMSRLPGTDLNFGSYEGWICVEIPEDAEDLIFTYAFAEEELAIPVEFAEDEAEAESETGDNSESVTENEDGYELTIPASTYRSMRASLYTEENTYSAMEADSYTIQIMYDDELYNVDGSIMVS